VRAGIKVLSEIIVAIIVLIMAIVFLSRAESNEVDEDVSLQQSAKKVRGTYISSLSISSCRLNSRGQ